MCTGNGAMMQLCPRAETHGGEPSAAARRASALSQAAPTTWSSRAARSSTPRGAVEHPEGSPPGSCYTNGIDALGVDGWVIRDNLIRGIYCRNDEQAGPAVLLWRGSGGSLAEGNTFLTSSRGVHLGLGPGDHTGGVVRNNFFRWDPAAPYTVDVPIYTVSAAERAVEVSPEQGLRARFAGSLARGPSGGSQLGSTGRRP